MTKREQADYEAPPERATALGDLTDVWRVEGLEDRVDALEGLVSEILETLNQTQGGR